MDDAEVIGPKHNRLGNRTELVVVSMFLLTLGLWLCAGTPGLK